MFRLSLKLIEIFYREHEPHICLKSDTPIPPKISSKIGRYFVDLPIVNIGALTQALLGFCIFEILWVEGISNDLNDLCRTTTHILTIVNIGGSNGYND